MRFWNRNLKLIAGDKEFDGENFDIEFSVPFSNSEDPDISEIVIYNLSKDSISSIKDKAYTILNAGYGDDIGAILIGNIESVETDTKSVDKKTTIKVSDGGIQWRNGTIKKTYKANTKASYIMKDLSPLLGLEVVEINPKKDIVYKRGKAVDGKIEKILKALAKDTKSKMFISKNKLYIRDKLKGNVTGFELNKETGMVGSPEKIVEDEETKYKVSCLLNHNITTDSIIDIKSKHKKGRFIVESGEHKDFVTSLKVVEA